MGRPGTGDSGADADGSSAPDVSINDSSTVPDAIPWTDDCAASARWIYAIDDADTLLRFEPDSRRLVELGTVRCTTGFDEHPFSMAVDRSGTAWVLYSTGEIYRVDTSTLACTRTSFSGDEDFDVFGMGFSSDAAMSDRETLFIAGGGLPTGGEGAFGTLDVTTMRAARLGDLSGSPELTGTGDGALWGFFPYERVAEVRRLDKTNGAAVETHRLTGWIDAPPRAWAFAFWGGRFYIFIKAGFDMSSRIWELNPATGAAGEYMSYTGHSIVGAGVSTCAPVILI